MSGSTFQILGTVNTDVSPESDLTFQVTAPSSALSVDYVAYNSLSVSTDLGTFSNGLVSGSSESFYDQTATSLADGNYTVDAIVNFGGGVTQTYSQTVSIDTTDLVLLQNTQPDLSNGTNTTINTAYGAGSTADSFQVLSFSDSLNLGGSLSFSGAQLVYTPGPITSADVAAGIDTLSYTVKDLTDGKVGTVTAQTATIIDNGVTANGSGISLAPSQQFDLTPLLGTLATLGASNDTLGYSGVTAQYGSVSLQGGHYIYTAPASLPNGVFQDSIAYTANESGSGGASTASGEVYVTLGAIEYWSGAAGNNDPTSAGNWLQLVSSSYTLPGFVPDSSTTLEAVSESTLNGVTSFAPVTLTLPTSESLTAGTLSGVAIALTNNGTMNVDQSFRPFLSSFLNTGTLTASNGWIEDNDPSGIARNSGALNFTGSLALSYGSLQDSPPSSNTIELLNETNATVTVGGPGYATLSLQALDNFGTVAVSLSSGTASLSNNLGAGVVAAGSTGSAVVNETGGQITVASGTAIGDSAQFQVASLTNNGSVTVGATSSGSIEDNARFYIGQLATTGTTLNNASQITVTAGSIDAQFGGTAINSGSILLDASQGGIGGESCLDFGTLDNSGTLALTSDDIINLDGSNLDNTGTISLSGSNESVDVTTLTNETGAVFNIDTASGVGALQLAMIDRAVTNNGSVNVAAHSNVEIAGAITASAGDSGRITLASSASLQLVGLTAGADIIGAGETIALNGHNDQIVMLGSGANDLVAGTIAGFSLGDSILFSGQTISSLSYDQTSGVLTVHLGNGNAQSFTFGTLPASVAFSTLSTAGGDEVVLSPSLSLADIPASQTGSDLATVNPFLNAQLDNAAPAATINLTVTLGNPANGSLIDLGGGAYTAASGVFSYSGSVALVDQVLNGLSFVPATGTSATTSFSVAVNDGAGGHSATGSTSLAIAGTPADPAPAFVVTSGLNLSTPIDLAAAGISTIVLGSAGGSLSGLGSLITGFTNLQVDGSWTLTGSNTLPNGVTITGGGELDIAAGSILKTGAGSSETFGAATTIFNNGTICLGGGDPAVFDGPLQGTGTVVIGPDDEATFNASVANGQTITFLDGTGTLVLNDPAAFQASIAGLQSGDVVDIHTASGVVLTGDDTSHAGQITLDFSDGSTETWALANNQNLSHLQINLGTDVAGDAQIIIGGANINPVAVGPTVANGSQTYVAGAVVNITAALLSLITPGTPGDAETIASSNPDVRYDSATGQWLYSVPSNASDNIVFSDTDQNGHIAFGNIAVTITPAQSSGGTSGGGASGGATSGAGPIVANGTATYTAGQVVDITAAIKSLITLGNSSDSFSIATSNPDVSFDSSTGQWLYTVPSTASDNIVFSDTENGHIAFGNLAVSISPAASGAGSAGGGSGSIAATLGHQTYVLAADGQNVTLVPYDIVEIDVSVTTANNIITGATPVSVSGGANTITGSLAGYDQIYVGNGNQTITLGSSNNCVITGTGNSSITGGSVDNSVTVAGGNNTISFTGGDNVVHAGSGNDTVSLLNGNWNNTIYAGSGTVTVSGDYGNSYVAGIGTLVVTDFTAWSGDTLDLRSLETTLGVAASSFSTGTDAADASYLDVTLTTGGTPTIVAALHNTSGSLSSLIAAGAIKSL